MFVKSSLTMNVMDPGLGTGAPMAYRMPNSAPILPVLPTRLQAWTRLAASLELAGQLEGDSHLHLGSSS